MEARLILVARELFFRDGYGATTMSAIAEGAHASKTTLYARFPSKAALLKAIVTEQIEDWSSGAQHTPTEQCDSLAEVLLVYGDIVLRAGNSADFVQLNRILCSEAGRFAELAQVADARVQLGLDFIAGRIRAFAERDQVRCLSPDGAAERFMMTLLGKSTRAMTANRVLGDGERAAWLAETVRIFIAGRLSW